MGKSFSFEIIRSLAKTAVFGIMFFWISFIVGFAFSKAAIPEGWAKVAYEINDQPVYNWFVCEDLGFGPVPGLPEPRQILRLCHNQGWEIRAYCLQPSLPAPPIGQTCSLTPEGTYWCGNSYQLLQEFILDVTPTSTAIPTETNTDIPTNTQQPSATFTPAYTASATFTPTEIPTDTPPPTFTPRVTRPATHTPIVTNTPAVSETGTLVASVTGTIVATQTPQLTQTGIPESSITPTTNATQTPQVSITITPGQVTETPLSTLSESPTVGPTERSETPVASQTSMPITPTSTPRPRPGGGGNLKMIGLLGISLGALSFAIGFLGLVLLHQMRFARAPQNILSKSISKDQKTFSSIRWLMLFGLLGMIILLGYLVSVWVPQLIIGQPQPIRFSEVIPFSPENSLTATPFQPRHPTPVFSLNLVADFSPTFDFQQIDFAPQSGGVQISIDPPSQQVNQGKPIDLSFIPSDTCDFGDQQACVSSHIIDQQNLVFLTIHSGFGGEGQAFRHAIEGTGINRAAFSLEHIDANLDALQNAQVSITTGGDEAGSFEVRGVIRIPASQIDEYFALPIEDALKFGASINPSVWAYIDPEQPVLIFETCGWKVPKEIGVEAVTDTTGSVYIVIIQPTR